MNADDPHKEGRPPAPGRILPHRSGAPRATAFQHAILTDQKVTEANQELMNHEEFAAWVDISYRRFDRLRRQPGIQRWLKDAA